MTRRSRWLVSLVLIAAAAFAAPAEAASTLVFKVAAVERPKGGKGPYGRVYCGFDGVMTLGGYGWKSVADAQEVARRLNALAEEGTRPRDITVRRARRSYLIVTPDQRIVEVNLTGTFHCCQVGLPDMVEAGWGRIVMISSSSAQRGTPFAAHYAASKGALLTLTKSLAREYAANGITVNNIPPSGIETPMQHASQAAGYLPSNEQIAAHIPVGHLGTPEDIAAAVGFLCSDQAGFITGQILGVNGGSVM